MITLFDYDYSNLIMITLTLLVIIEVTWLDYDYVNLVRL